MVIDQSGHDIQQAGQNLTETASIDSPNNGLNLTALLTTPAQTDANGQFYDNFKFCSSVCPNQTATTAATQNITDTYNGAYNLNQTGLLYACGYVKSMGRSRHDPCTGL